MDFKNTKERPPFKGMAATHEKYGRGNQNIGYGQSGNVRLSRKTSLNNPKPECYAIKEYQRGPRETMRAYRNRSTSSFCISSCLRHINVIDTLDLVQEPDGNYCEVMAFCDGGNLAILILRREKLGPLEADCFFKQLACGVEYLHSVGVAHRDLKPENLLLTSRGILKIGDFGEAECFRFPWEAKARVTTGRCGSIPYIAPEQYLDGEIDPRPVDVWPMGMVYMAMRTGKLLWDVALKHKDNNYIRYLCDRTLPSGFRPIERLQNVSHKQPPIFLEGSARIIHSLGRLPEHNICHPGSVTLAQDNCFASISLSLVPRDTAMRSRCE
jgi:protein-serine/threonine kinase